MKIGEPGPHAADGLELVSTRSPRNNSLFRKTLSETLPTGLTLYSVHTTLYVVGFPPLVSTTRMGVASLLRSFTASIANSGRGVVWRRTRLVTKCVGQGNKLYMNCILVTRSIHARSDAGSRLPRSRDGQAW